MAVTRGFVGRRTADSSRVPPGQYVTRDFPVLSAGPTPYTPLDAWDFTIRGAVDKPVSWSWTEFKALPREKFTVDIHCVTKWTKLDMAWSGVSLDTFLDATPTQAALCTGVLRRRLHHQHSAGGPARWEGLDRRRVRRAAA